MKTLFFSLITAICLLICVEKSSATVWRVNNTTGVDADFSSLATAIATAAAGDTLYLEGSANSYGTITLAKKLTIIGSGYFLSGYGNDSTQANPSPSAISLLTINSGAGGSVICGVTVNGNPAYGSSTVTVNTSDITFLRCYFTSSAAYQTYTTQRNGMVFTLAGNVNNIVVSGCFIYQQYTYTSTTCSSGCSWNVFAVYLSGSNYGCAFTNNIIKQGVKGTASTYSGMYAFYMQPGSTAMLVNNVFIGPIAVYGSTFSNNIQVIGGGSGNYITSGSYPNITQNNIGHSTQFGTTNGNKSSISMTTVFGYTPGSEDTDNHYRLKAGSPALAAGTSGEDCGAFGGSGAYLLSGLPAIPAIFSATIPAIGTTSSGININIKAKAVK